MMFSFALVVDTLRCCDRREAFSTALAIAVDLLRWLALAAFSFEVVRLLH